MAAVVIYQTPPQGINGLLLQAAVDTGVNRVPTSIQIVDQFHGLLSNPFAHVRAGDIDLAGEYLGGNGLLHCVLILGFGNGLLVQHACQYYIASAQRPFRSINGVAGFRALGNASQHGQLCQVELV